MALAPLAPEGVGLGGLAVSFLILSCAVVLFGLVRGSAYLVNVIKMVVQAPASIIPGVGWLVKKITDPVFGTVERFLADSALGLQGAIGFYWHGLATIAKWQARELRSHSNLLWTLAQLAIPAFWPGLVIGELNKHRGLLARLQVGIDRTVHDFVHTVETLPARARAAVAPRLGALDHEIGHVILPDIAGLRARTRSILDSLDGLWSRIRGLDKLLGTAAFAEAVAVALAALGASWIRCRNWNRIGKSVCGLPLNLIEDILAISLALEVVVDPVAIAEAALTTEDALQGLVEAIAA